MRTKFYLSIKGLFYLICSALIMGSYLSCDHKKKESLAYYYESKKYVESKNYNNAYDAIEMAILKDSTNYDFLIQKAVILSNLEQDIESISILKNLLNKEYKKDTVNFLIGYSYFNISSFYLSSGKNYNKSEISLENAIYYLDEALKKNPKYIKAYIIKSDSYHNLEKHKEALITLNTALNIFPNNDILLYYRGVQRFLLGDIKNAINDLDYAINGNSLDSVDYSDAYRFRGLIYYERDDYERAIDDLTNAIKYNNTNFYAFYNRGGIYKTIGEKEKACKDFFEAVDLGFTLIYDDVIEYCN